MEIEVRDLFCEAKRGFQSNSLLKKSLFAAQISFFDNSKACSTANSKLALRAQTVEFAVISLT